MPFVERNEGCSGSEMVSQSHSIISSVEECVSFNHFNFPIAECGNPRFTSFCAHVCRACILSRKHCASYLLFLVSPLLSLAAEAPLVVQWLWGPRLAWLAKSRHGWWMPFGCTVVGRYWRPAYFCVPDVRRNELKRTFNCVHCWYIFWWTFMPLNVWFL